MEASCFLCFYQNKCIMLSYQFFKFKLIRFRFHIRIVLLIKGISPIAFYDEGNICAFEKLDCFTLLTIMMFLLKCLWIDDFLNPLKIRPLTRCLNHKMFALKCGVGFQTSKMDLMHLNCEISLPTIEYFRNELTVLD